MFAHKNLARVTSGSKQSRTLSCGTDCKNETPKVGIKNYFSLSFIIVSSGTVKFFIKIITKALKNQVYSFYTKIIGRFRAFKNK